MRLRLEKDFTTTDTKITKKSSDIPRARSAKDAKFRKFFLCAFASLREIFFVSLVVQTVLTP
jgi:hypothetical protein